MCSASRDAVLTKWKPEIEPEMRWDRCTHFNTLLFAYDQVVTQDSENKFQKSI